MEAENIELERLKKNPYTYISNWMEEVLINTGKNVFDILSLVPCSLILPDIPFSSSKIRSQINVLLLASPSSGKSTITKKFAKIAYQPIEFRRITSAKLIQEILNSRLFTIINEDFSQIADDYDIIKVLEGVTGEEKRIADKTMQREIDISTQGCALICGTPIDLIRYMHNLEGGLFSRFIPLMITHTAKQHSEIGKFITDKMGDEGYHTNLVMKEDLIVKYYQELSAIQEGKHPNIPAIKKYNIPVEFRDGAYNIWKDITEDIVSKGDTVYFRDLQEFYRVLVAHAFLNVFNRKIDTFKDDKEKGGRLHIEKEDYQVALGIMKQSIQFKFYLARAKALNMGIRNADSLRKILNQNIPEQAKAILLNISPYAIKSGMKL